MRRAGCLGLDAQELIKNATLMHKKEKKISA